MVVIGAGFGGLAAARELAAAPVDVTLIDRHNFNTFQPLLYQVATAGLNAGDVAHAVRGIFQGQANVTFRNATVTDVHWETDRLTVQDQDGRPGDLPFDYLVIAAGSSTAFFGVPGAPENALPLYSLSEAVKLRSHVLSCFEEAAVHSDLIDDGLLTFVVVGGGPTGVETSGALAELFSHVLTRDFADLEVARARVVLVEMGDSLLAGFHDSSRRHALDTLTERGVEVRLGQQVADVAPTRVRLASGEELRAHTLVWAAGVSANPLAQILGVATAGGGRIVVGEDLRIPGRPCAFAIGDIAHIPGRAGALPQLAPVALQSGRHAARQIARLVERAPTAGFRYVDKGTMATIGRRAAVAELPFGIRMRGTIAWLAWLGLHIAFLMGFRNRLSVMLNWAWNYLTWDRGPRLIFRSDEPR